MSQPGPDFTKPQYPTGADFTPPPVQSAARYSAAPDGTERGIAVLTHLAALIASALSIGSLPFLGPLIVWFMYKDKNPFIRQAAAGAFNFNLWATVLALVGYLFIATFIGVLVGVPMVFAAVILTAVFSIVGAVRANRGEAYNYPFQIRVLS